MKNQFILLFVFLGLSFNAISQINENPLDLSEPENREIRKWNYVDDQNTYYMGEQPNESNEFRSTDYPQSPTNNPDTEGWNDLREHRAKAIWADNSTIVSDEKTGRHAFIPYIYVGEDDILWAKRVKKVIDVRVPQNHPIYFPVQVNYDRYFDDGGGILLNEVLSGVDARKNLFQILKDAATTITKNGEPLVSVYNSSLTRKFSTREIIGDRSNAEPGVFQRRGTQRFFDDFGEEIDQIDIVIDYAPLDIVGYYIEEEVFFDKRRAKLDYRYVSITPLVRGDGALGLYTGDGLSVKPLGTFYFPEIRHLLANHKVYPLDDNIAQRMSFDEYFHRKLFASNIIKETNMYDRNISDYLPGRTLDQLLEGERIKEQIRLYETDMWNY